MKSDYPSNYARALRYSMESPWALMKKRLVSEPELRWGTHPEAAEFRPIAADAYQDETGDEVGAAHLRNPQRHVVLDGDKIKRGRFQVGSVLQAARRVNEHLSDITGQYVGDGYGLAVGHDNHFEFGADEEPTERQHLSKLPGELASRLGEEGRDWFRFFVIPDHREEMQRHQQLLEHLRNSPIEEPHPDQSV